MWLMRLKKYVDEVTDEGVDEEVGEELVVKKKELEKLRS